MSVLVPTPTLAIEEYDWQEACTRLGAQWRTLLASSYKLNISLSPGWLNAILSSKDVAVTLRVLVARRDEEVVGLFPYYSNTVRMFGVPMTMIEIGGNLMSYHQEI